MDCFGISPPLLTARVLVLFELKNEVGYLIICKRTRGRWNHGCCDQSRMEKPEIEEQEIPMTVLDAH